MVMSLNKKYARDVVPSTYTEDDHKRIVIRNMQTHSLIERRKRNHAQPSLPRITAFDETPDS